VAKQAAETDLSLPYMGLDVEIVLQEPNRTRKQEALPSLVYQSAAFPNYMLGTLMRH
jgi:hypothetical protein